MKFPTINTAKSKTLHIDAPSGGLNCLEVQNFGGFEECKNVYKSGDVLKNRPGIYTSEENLLDNADFRGGFSYKYEPVDVSLNVFGDEKKIFLEKINYDDSTYVYITYFVGSDGVIDYSSRMLFSRSSSSVFFIPENIVFLKGRVRYGLGLFSIVNLVNMEDFSQTETRIFELSSNLSNWELVSTAYTPTVLINGRGNRYEYATSSNQVFTGEPTRLEKLNLLTGKFKAYFSTDGRSDSFRLPFSNIANKEVTCRLFYKLGSYAEWKIQAGKNSATIKYLDVDVTMHVDREKGIVYFTVPAGDFEVPLIDHQNENNLLFTATKECNYNLWDIGSCTSYISTDSKNILAKDNVIFESDCEKPLYFPLDTVTVLGQDNSPITALYNTLDEILAFKKNETYRISIKDGKALNSVSLLADNDAFFYSNDVLQTKLICDNVGCPDKNTVTQENGVTLWQGSNGMFYGLENSGEKVFSVCDKIKPFIETEFYEEPPVYGVNFGEYSLFFYENKALAVKSTDYESNKNTSWYCWEFSDNLRFLGACNQLGKPWILCCNTDINVCFTATLQGDCDVLLTNSVYAPKPENVPIKCSFKCHRLSLGCNNTLKKIESVIIRLKLKKAKVMINDRLEADICRHLNSDEYFSARLAPGLCGVDSINVSLRGEAPLCVGNIDINYTELKI